MYYWTLTNYTLMEIIKAPLKRFMTKYERYEPAVRDHTSLITAKTCKRKYFLKIVLGFRPKQTPSYFAFGSAYHKFREVLEKTSKVEDAISAAITYWSKHGTEPQVGTRWEFLTGGRLLASCKAAFTHWQKERAAGQMKVIAVEQFFQVTLSDGKTVIGGRADQILRWNGKLWGRDFKTSSKMGKFYDRTLEPNNQFMLYTVAESKLSGERVLGQLVEVMYNTDKEGPKVVPLMTSRTEDQTNEWEQDIIFYERLLAMCREADRYPMEESQCPFCEFHSVCKAPSEGAMMGQLESNFHQVAWDYSNPSGETESE